MWTETDEGLKATYETGSFASGLRLVNAIGDLAEAANHHPDIVLTYPKVDVTLISHDVGAVTDRDRALAAQIDEAWASLESPGG